MTNEKTIFPDHGDDYKAADDYANSRYDKHSQEWAVAYAAFVAGIQWRNEPRENSE